MGNLEESTLFKQLHEDYFNSTDERERLNLRNAIFEQVSPLLVEVVGYFSKGRDLDWDMFQSVAERILCVIIPQWVPRPGSSIEGYYKRCFHNACLNIVDEAKWRQKIEVLVDPLDSPFWNMLQSEPHEDMEIVYKFKFKEDKKQEIYEACVLAIQSGSLQRQQNLFLDELTQKSGFSRKETRVLFNHALVTCRENYHLLMVDLQQEVCSETLFGRLCELLDVETIQRIVKIFGGMKIAIPEWKGK